MPKEPRESLSPKARAVLNNWARPDAMLLAYENQSKARIASREHESQSTEQNALQERDRLHRKNHRAKFRRREKFLHHRRHATFHRLHGLRLLRDHHRRHHVRRLR